MELCNERNHDAIVHDETDCPLCDLMDKAESTNASLVATRERLSNLINSITASLDRKLGLYGVNHPDATDEFKVMMNAHPIVDASLIRLWMEDIQLVLVELEDAKVEV